MRTQVLGLGSYVPERIVPNDELRFLTVQQERADTLQMETNDEWIQTRTGIRERRYAAPGVATSDLALEAARRAMAEAGTEAKDIDCIIFGTLSPDIHFPGSAVFLQQKLGVAGEGKGKSAACFDIRQQCSAFVYGMQMADAFIKAGMYQRVLLVGAEVHSHCLDFSTRGRDVTVLFGDGAGAMVLGPLDSDDPRAGVAYTDCHADGSGAMNLHLKIFEISKAPYFADLPGDPERRQAHLPADGRQARVPERGTQHGHVERQGARRRGHDLGRHRLVRAAPGQPADQREGRGGRQDPRGQGPQHDPALRQHDGRDRAADDRPLAPAGQGEEGRPVLSTVFGAGFTWGSAIFQV
jgi:3-oxoacyl-(acyl-carrier-protein) synthase III